MNLEGVAWLENKVPEFGNLKNEEKSEIIDFCMLWSFFEGTRLNEKANNNSIREFVYKFERGGYILELSIDEFVNYFTNRYIQNGVFTDHYNGLHLNLSGNPKEVVQMLTNHNATTAVKLIGCLFIIYRFRNNLFHGVKWQYNFRGQLANFNYANRLLKKLMN